MRSNRFLVTSIIRQAGVREKSGGVRVVDIRDKRVLMRSIMPQSVFRTKDPNPRGGLRGARGAAVFEDRLVLANAERLFIFNRSWELTGEITHPLMGGIHDLLAEEDGIWVACTTADLLIKVSWPGDVLEIWEWRKDENLANELGFRNLPSADRDLDYRDPENMRDGVRNIVHLNSIFRGERGLWVSFGRILSPQAFKRAGLEAFAGKVARKLDIKPRHRKVDDLNRSPEQAFIPRPPGKKGSSWAAILLQADGNASPKKIVRGVSVPNHNLIESGDVLIYNDSNNDRVVKTHLDGRHPDQNVKIPGNPGFSRGLCQTGEDMFLVGSQNPFAVYQVDFHTGSVITTFPLDGAQNETVYGIYLIPNHFDDPPETLFSW